MGPFSSVIMLQPLLRRLGLAAAFLVVAIPASLAAQTVRRFGLRTPMRDGVALVSDLWLPRGGAGCR